MLRFMAIIGVMLLAGCGFHPHQLDTHHFENKRIYIDYHGSHPALKHTVSSLLETKTLVTTNTHKDADYILHILELTNTSKPLRDNASSDLRVYPLTATLVYSLSDATHDLISNQRIVIRDRISVGKNKTPYGSNQLKKAFQRMNQQAAQQLANKLLYHRP